MPEPADTAAAEPAPTPARPNRRVDWTVTFHLLAVALMIVVYATVTLCVEEATANEQTNFTLHVGFYAAVVFALAALARFRPATGAIVAVPVVALWGLSVGPIGPAGAVVSLAALIVAARAAYLALRSPRRSGRGNNAPAIPGD